MTDKELESFLKRRLEIKLSSVNDTCLKVSLMLKSESYKDRDTVISEDFIEIHSHRKDPFKRPNMYMFNV